MASARKAGSVSLRAAQAILDGMTAASRHLRNVKLSDGMTQERLAALSVISTNEPISVSDLAASAKVRVATMSRMVSAFSDDGLIRRTADKDDGRGVLISLTAKGRRVYTKANQKSLKRLQDLLRELSDDEVTALSALADKLNSLD